MNLNVVHLAGRLTRTPELRYAKNGTAVAECDIAINKKWRTESGEEKESVTFVSIAVFGRTAENTCKYCDKGSTIFVVGALRLESWDDKQTGQKRSKLKVVAQSVQFVGSPKDAPGEASPPAARPGAGKPAERTQTASEIAKGRAAASEATEDDSESDQIPF